MGPPERMRGAGGAVSAAEPPGGCDEKSTVDPNPWGAPDPCPCGMVERMPAASPMSFRLGSVSEGSSGRAYFLYFSGSMAGCAGGRPSPSKQATTTVTL